MNWTSTSKKRPPKDGTPFIGIWAEGKVDISHMELCYGFSNMTGVYLTVNNCYDQDPEYWAEQQYQRRRTKMEAVETELFSTDWLELYDGKWRTKKYMFICHDFVSDFGVDEDSLIRVHVYTEPREDAVQVTVQFCLGDLLWSYGSLEPSQQMYPALENLFLESLNFRAGQKYKLYVCVEERD